MAFTRADVRAILGAAHTEDIENRLIALHLGVVDPLKDSLQTYKADAEKLPGVQKELDDLKKQGDVAAIRREFDEYKAGVERRETRARKESALLAAVEGVGVTRPAFKTAILKAWDMDTLELTEDGKPKDAEGLAAAIKKDFADFIPETKTDPAPSADPPKGDPKGKDAFEAGFDE